jgi:hypothetical protein
MKYAGIGSRFAPKEILIECTEIGKNLAKLGFILRSGHANGCDLAFEIGCDDCNGEKEIFLPWKKFNGSSSQYFLNWEIDNKLEEIASSIYPNWRMAKHYVKSLHARNVQQILGKNADDKSDFVVCYTDRPYDDPYKVGGTMFGIKLAMKHGIPVYNLILDKEREEFYKKWLIAKI